MHDRIFFDVPPDTTQLVIEAEGAANNQSNNLTMEVYREDFETALANPPFVQLPGGLNPIATADGAGGNGPSISINSMDTITPGRYYIKLINQKAAHASVTIMATATSNASSLSPHQGLWGFTRRISQGVSWNLSSDNEFGLWYTYDENGQPVWFIFARSNLTGNIFTTDLLRVTNDGALQQEKRAGQMSLTFIGDGEAIFSYRLYGRGGFDPLDPNVANTCPLVNGIESSYTGHWGRGIPGLGGATIMVFEAAQAQVHYIFDDRGYPRWLFASPDGDQSATVEVLDLLQFVGFCAVCAEIDPSFDVAGTVMRSFADEENGSWTLDFDLLDPLSQRIMRTDDPTKKFSEPVDCLP